ncbi:MAG: hypothetical protein EBV71_06095, partial [Chitinophagia bacterium]|nr:hypothetical protein [Chitinophagia bacterium]
MRKILNLLFGLSFLFSASVLNAQVCGYTFSQTSGTYTPISGGTYLYGNSAGNAYWDDGTSPNHPIGFNFNFAGTTFDRFSLNPNGYITMGSSIVYDLYNVLCSSRGSGRDNVISALTTDLYALSGCGSNGAIQYLTTGTAPNRVLTVQWGNVGVYGWSTSFCLNFQIKLYETTNKVEIVYGTFNIAASATRDFQVGIAGSSECDFLIRQVTSSGSWDASTSGLTACSQCYASSTIK